jgi:hypothetical protein
MKMGIHQALIGQGIQPFWIPAFVGMTVRDLPLALRVTAISSPVQQSENPNIVCSGCKRYLGSSVGVESTL